MNGTRFFPAEPAENAEMIEKLEPIHEAQLLSYLKLSGCRVGLLINFNVKMLKQGIRRMVNNFP